MKQQSYQKTYLRRAKAVAAFLQIVPFVRMVCLNGSVAAGVATKPSDIDLFIFLKEGRLWSGRLFVTLAVHLAGLRRFGNKIAGRICLNRYQTDNYLLISPPTQENAKHHSFTKIFWADAGLAMRLIETNTWMRRFDFQISKQNPKLNFLRILTRPIQLLGETLFEIFLNEWAENWARNYQTKRILADPRTKKSPSGTIYISEIELRFHPPKNPCPEPSRGVDKGL